MLRRSFEVSLCHSEISTYKYTYKCAYEYTYKYTETKMYIWSYNSTVRKLRNL